jgi:hypothetical protein
MKPTDLKPEFTFTNTAFPISDDIWYCGHVCIGIAWMDDESKSLMSANLKIKEALKGIKLDDDGIPYFSIEAKKMVEILEVK